MSLVVAAHDAVEAAPPGVRRWIDLGEDPGRLLAAERGGLAGLERISIADARATAATEFRRPYLDWIGGLGAANDGPDWWASELAAKNVYTHLFQRLCTLRAAAAALQDGMVVTCSSAATMDVAAAMARERGIAVTVLGRPGRTRRRVRDAGFGVISALPRRRPPSPRPGGEDTLLVTWVDGRNFDADGSYRDPHLGRLPDLLAARGHRVALLARILPTAPYAQTAARLAAGGVPAFLPEAFLTVADRRRCWTRARRFNPQMATDARVGGVPLAGLARELVAHHRVSHAAALSYDPLLARLAADGMRPTRIVVPWEGHAWETSLFDAARRHLPKAELIAYENLNFSSLALSLYPGAGEVGRRPLPDRIVTNGATFARILEAEGIPASMIRRGCALRHEGLHERPASDRTGDVLVAGSIDASQTVELVEAAHAALGDRIAVKLHPAADITRIRRDVRAPVRYVDQPIAELLEHARAMLYTYSIVPYEALAAGVPPVFFRSESLLDIDQLEPTPDVRWVGRTPDELRAALEAAEAAAATDAWRERARSVVADAFTPVSAACVDAFVGDRG